MNTAHRSAARAAGHGIISGAVLASALVTGCAVGPGPCPRAHRPRALQRVWGECKRGHVAGRMVAGVHDAPLDRLVERAIDANLDLRIAESRVREARATRRSPVRTLADRGWRRRLQPDPPERDGPLGGAVRRGLVPLETDLYEAALDASWEIDIFGGTRRAVESSEAEIGAGDEARRDVLVSLLGEVGSSYMELRGLQQELAVTQVNIKAQEQTLALTRDRVQAGLATELDVTCAQAQLATTRAEVPNLTSALKRAVHRLSVLVGVSPGELAGQWLQVLPVPAGPPDLPAGVPSDLLRRRPDIRRAERELAAATARIGVATADLFPRFSLTGAVGVQSVAASDFFTGGNRFFALGPAIHWPIFNAGRIRDNIEVQDLRQEQALLAYRQTVLLGLEEVENALVTHRAARLRFQELCEAEGAERRAVTLAHDRYRRARGFFDVLDSGASGRRGFA